MKINNDTMMASAIIVMALAVTAVNASADSSATQTPPPVAGQTVSGVIQTSPGAKYVAPHKQSIGSAGIIGAKSATLFPGDPPYAHMPVTTSPVMMYEIALDGPDRTSPDFPAWATDVVSNMYNRGCPITITNSSWSHSFRLSPSDIYQSAGLTNRTLWYAIQVVAIDPSFMFTPSNLWFVGRSSDDSDSLGKTNFFNDPTYAYSPWGQGYRWGPNGPRTSDTVYDNPASGSWNNVPVNEFIFIGAESVYYTGDSNNVVAYVNSFYFPNFGFGVTGQWFLQCSNGVVAMSQVQLKTEGTMVMPSLTIQRGYNGTVSLPLGANGEANHTVVVQYRNPLIRGYAWRDICTLNPGEAITWPTDNSLGTFDQGYFRYYMEQ